MHLEPLENRTLLSVTVSEAYPGVYELHGDENADTIEVSISMSDETMTFEGNTYEGVAYIFVHGYGGDDTITVHSQDGPGAIGASISSGYGNDTVVLNFDGAVWAGAGNDSIRLTDSFRGEAYGDLGNDTITIAGACVDAAISGGDGNDFIDCSGNLTGVIVSGGAGNDTIYGSAFDDQLFGDDGIDKLIGGGGRDATDADEAFPSYRGPALSPA
jgi:Ca2+-binding RTX toxin-like protein